MVILAFDLAFTGPTGWVLWAASRDDPVVDYGWFEPRVKKGQEVYAAWEIYQHALDIISQAPLAIELVAYEITDWHRSLNLHSNWKTEYAIERQAQRTLGRAETSVLIAATQNRLPAVAIGANEAKKEFGAVRKDAIARYLAGEYRRFEFIEEAGENDKEFLVDTLLNKRIPHHVSDAFVIAKVAANRSAAYARLGNI